MITGALDEDVRGAIVRGLRQYRPSLDTVSVRGTHLCGATDGDVLEWAAGEERIVFTHDARTMAAAAYRRITEGLPMPGLFVAHQSLSTGIAIEQIALILEAGKPGEWNGQARYLPL